MTEILGEMKDEHIGLAEYIMLDRGYDSKNMLETIREKRIKPIVDNRIMRKGDKTQQGKIYRIRVADDRRIFNEVARNSKKFKRLYNERTPVERYNGRIDRDYAMEKHCIRGLSKMELEMTMNNIIMLVMAKVHCLKGHTNYASLLNF